MLPEKHTANTLAKKDAISIKSTMEVADRDATLAKFEKNYLKAIHSRQPHEEVKERAKDKMNMLWNMVPPGYEGHPNIFKLASGMSSHTNEKYKGLYTAKDLKVTRDSDFYKIWDSHFKVVHKAYNGFKDKRVHDVAVDTISPVAKKGKKNRPN